MLAAAGVLGMAQAGAVGPPPGGTDISLIRPRSGGVNLHPATERLLRRRRPVDLDLGALRRATRRPGGRLRFDLFADVRIAGVVESVERRASGGYSVAGRLEGDRGWFVLAVEQARLSGSIRTDAGPAYLIGSDLDGNAIVEEPDLESGPACAGAVLPPATRTGFSPPGGRSSGESLPITTLPTAPDPPDVIDLLVAYTPRAEVASGGPAAANALAQRAVDEANRAYLNSGITTRLRLVWRGRTEYDDSSGSPLDHLTRLRDPADGFMDELHARRDATGADVVSLIVDDDETAGVGYLMVSVSPLFESSAFNVGHVFAVSNNLTLAHEIGHNEGCEHDRANATTNPAFNYAYGERFTGNDGRAYRTVMGYPPGVRIPYFSNPNVLYQGQPTGRANKEDNARAINATAATVANFRASRRHPGSLRDFDGNGFDDLSIFDTLNGDWWVGLSRGDEFDVRRWGAWSPVSGWGARLEGDFDGDGWKDVAAWFDPAGEWWVGLSRGDRFDTLRWGSLTPVSGWGPKRAADFNGDGKDDIVTMRDPGGELWVGLSTGTGFAMSLWGQLPYSTGWSEILAGDYDGDGRKDLAAYHQATGEWWVARSSGAGFSTSLWDRPASSSAWTAAVQGDFNGDGREDVASLLADGTWWIGTSNGTTFVSRSWGGLAPGGGWGPLFAGDFDGDGIDDIATLHSADAQWWVAVSSGSDLSATVWSSLVPASGWTDHAAGDFDGDGRLDVASYLASRGEWWVGTSSGAQFATSLWAKFVLPHPDVDTDGDGSSDADDCDPTNAAAWAFPGEVEGLMIDQPGGAGAAIRLRWPEPASMGGTSVQYDVLRSTSPWYFQWNEVACVETNDGTDREALDPAVPAPAFFYLVRAGNSCGEGDLGAGSQAAPRIAASCP
jgi:hypothetical protein